MKIIPKIVFQKNRLLDEEIMAVQGLIKMWDNMLNLMIGRFIKALLYWKTVVYSEINFGVLMYKSHYFQTKSFEKAHFAIKLDNT